MCAPCSIAHLWKQEEQEILLGHKHAFGPIHVLPSTDELLAGMARIIRCIKEKYLRIPAFFPECMCIHIQAHTHAHRHTHAHTTAVEVTPFIELLFLPLRLTHINCQHLHISCAWNSKTSVRKDNVCVEGWEYVCDRNVKRARAEVEDTQVSTPNTRETRLYAPV